MGSLAPSTRGPLGCGSYSVRLVNDGRPILETKRVTSVVWGRRLDEVSTATITIPVAGTDLRACCERANLIEPLRTEVEITRDGFVVWVGYLMRDVTFSRDHIIINAHDILGWTERRVLGNHDYVATDLLDIALGYLADPNLDDFPWLSLIAQATPTGILADRKVLASEYRFASDPLGELYETGLDITVAAGRIYIGPEVATCGHIVLRDTDFNGSPEVKLDGLERATRVIVKGANGIVSVYPPEPEPHCYRDADHVSEDQDILDQASADARAQSLYARLSSSYPYYVHIPQGSGLRSTAGVHINALIPGNKFQFESKTLCIPIAMGMRLVALDVEASSGSEQVRVTLEPLGDHEGVAA